MNTDETPPTDNTPEPPTEHPAPPPEKVAKEEGEKVPAWGQALIDKVDHLTSVVPVSQPRESELPPAEDETPMRKPWHKRNPMKGE